ncbi:Rne/Rng family ribonuclease [bacterium]|nr:Rne/Rng family ribonuclease [bacterium]
MARQIIINSTPQEARVATMENARLLEIQIERVRERSLAGSICKGRVLRVLPGMQAAFVDIGLEKAAFLPGADFFPLSADEYALRETPPDTPDTPPGDDAASAGAEDAGGRRARVLPPIEERLQKGQDVIVQISKEPIGSKGARLTSNISLPGRYLVYLPYSNQIGISRRLASEEERQRLREAVEAVASESGGIIIRTACEGVSKREIQSDLRLLRRQWQHLSRKAESLPAPAILHQELDVILRTMRDLSASDVTRVMVDNRRDYQRILDFTDEVMPRARPRVELYELPEPIFERYGIEAQINKALERKVWLKSGGYIVIDHTEALTAIDVNTGRFIGKTDQRETALRTNLEAARVIADQLRLRNIGGLIIIDFIDMDHAEDRKAVLAALNESIKGDKARATILGISELGLVEMTRQRTRESLAQRLCEPCPTCNQRGLVKGVATTAYEALRRIRREATLNGAVQRLEVALPGPVLAFLHQYEPAALREIERELGVPIAVSERSDASVDYAILPVVAKEAAK